MDVFERLDLLQKKMERAGWKEIWQVTDDWWMVGFQRGREVKIVAVVEDQLRTFIPEKIR